MLDFPHDLYLQMLKLVVEQVYNNYSKTTACQYLTTDGTMNHNWNKENVRH